MITGGRLIAFQLSTFNPGYEIYFRASNKYRFESEKEGKRKKVSARARARAREWQMTNVRDIEVDRSSKQVNESNKLSRQC